MAAADVSDIKHCREAPPWSWCGDRGDPAFGSVFAWPGADGAVVLSFDRRGRRHAMTLFRPARLEPEVVIFGRRFSVVTGRDAAG